MEQKNRITNFLQNIDIKEYIYYWLKKREPYIKTSTYATYLSNIENHILPYFNSIDFKNITVDTNQKFILYLSQQGRLHKEEGLSAKTVKDIMSLWLSILKSAKEDRIINLQDFHYRYPQSNNEYKIEKVKCLSIEQETQIINFLKSHPNAKNIGILLSLSTGIRIGELCALRWKNINLQNKEIYITETLQRIYIKNIDNKNNNILKGTSKIILTKPKSSQSIRIIPLAEYLIKLLTPLQKPKDCFFLTGFSNRWMEPRTYRDYYNRLLKKENLLFVTFHGLRHTFATRCIETGCDYKTVSELLGHTNIETTLRLYVHSNMERKRKCIDIMHNLWQF